MLLRETIRKSKFLLHKTLRNFKCFIFGGYQKLPRSFSFDKFLGRSGNARTYTTSDQFYNEFYDILQSDLNRMNRNGVISNMSRPRDQAMGNDSAGTRRHVSFAKQSPQKSIAAEDEVQEKKKNKGKKYKGELKNEEGVHHDLAQKMKELEMIDSGDVEHILDIEEALHYYSRLTSPVYLDIVDKFFIDMHSEYTLPLPQSSVRRSTKHSKSKGRRLGSIRL